MQVGMWGPLERPGWVVTVPDSGCHPRAPSWVWAGWAGRSPVEDTGAVLVNEPLVVGPQLVHIWQVGALGVEIELAAARRDSAS